MSRQPPAARRPAAPLLRGVQAAPLLAALAAGLSTPAAAGERPGQLVAELNKLETSEGVCRAYLLLKNGTDQAFESLKLDLVLFDGDGIVASRLAVEAGPLPPAKTSLKVFDAAASACSEIGALLLNDVLACRDGSGQRADCLALVAPAARTAAAFYK